MSTENPPVMPITVKISRDGGITVVHVAGEVDMYSVDPFAEAVQNELAARPVGVVINLLDVSFCGSSGLHVLVRARHEAASNGVGLCVVAAGLPVLRPMDISGLTGLFDLHESVPEAVRNLAARVNV